MSEQRSELIKLFGSLHNAVNEKPWDQTKVSGCLLDITAKFDYDDTKIKDLEAKLQVAVENIENLIHANERMFIQLGKQKRDLIYIHNSDEPSVTKNNLRADVLVIASNIGYELDAVNFWNIKPAIEKAKQALEKIKGESIWSKKTTEQIQESLERSEGEG